MFCVSAFGGGRMRILALPMAVSVHVLWFGAAAAEAPEVVETLPTVTIEGRLPKKPPPKNPMVQVSAGAGRKELDPPRNELGVELKTMERFEELSLERRLEKWWLEPGKNPADWQSQAHADFSLDQKVRLRSEGPASGYRTRVEGGYWRDHRDLILLVNDVNPYDASFARKQAVSNASDGSFFVLGVDGDDWQALGDFDSRGEDVHAGALLTGRKAAFQQSLSGRWQRGRFQLLPFVQTRQGKFDSAVSRWLTNETRGARAGVQSDFASRSGRYRVESTVSVETMARSFADQSRASFQRVAPAVTATKEFSSDAFDAALNLGGEAAFEQIEDVKGRNTADAAIWNFAGELSSSKRNFMGVAGRFRRFAIMPTPSQRFGDGALLLGSGDLAPETGLRLSAGPWLKSDQLEIELSVFYERSANAPVIAAVSPSSARTFAIGGVWARGVELRGLLRQGRWAIEASYGYLEALNDSEIEWQRGKPIPGRPRHAIKTNIDYGGSGWKSGAGYGYRSEDALDLAGLWFSPPKHALDVYIGYGAKTWEARLAGGKLLAGLNSLPASQFSGRASPDLLQPTIEQTEVRLQCEFLM